MVDFSRQFSGIPVRNGLRLFRSIAMMTGCLLTRLSELQAYGRCCRTSEITDVAPL